MGNQIDYEIHQEKIGLAISGCLEVIYELAEKHFETDEQKICYSKEAVLNLFGNMIIRLTCPESGYEGLENSLTASLKAYHHFVDMVLATEKIKLESNKEKH